jgi:excisionase family DNA binding protein
MPQLSYRLPDAAKALDCSTQTIRRMIRRGQLRVVMIGPKSPRVPASELDHLLASETDRVQADLQRLQAVQS